MKNNNHQSHYLLHSYCLHPNIHFETQGKNEKVILVLRAHPFTQLFWVFNTLVLVILLIVSNFLLPSFLNIRQLIFINVFGLIFALSYVWFNFLSWFFNVGIITTERVIDIDFSSVIYKEVTAAKLDRIEDITSKAGGYFESFFDYGDVFVQTAGTEANIEFLNVPKPSQVVETINGLLEK